MTTLEKITAALSFGRAYDDGFETDNENPADGGWVNVRVSVAVGGRVFGDALIGAWVYTDASRGQSLDIYNECLRDGFAIRHYYGNERQFEAGDSRSWQEIFGLTDEEAEDLDDGEIEEAILDAADESSDVDYEALFAYALRDRLENTRHDGTNDLMRAVRCLYGE